MPIFHCSTRYRILALRKISGIVALGIGLRFVSLSYCGTQCLILAMCGIPSILALRIRFAPCTPFSCVVVLGIEESGRNVKIFQLCASCGSFRDSKPTFFRHFKELTLHQQALSVRWSLAKNCRQSMFVNFARNFFRGLESVLAHSSKMLFRKITP